MLDEVARTVRLLDGLVEVGHRAIEIAPLEPDHAAVQVGPRLAGVELDRTGVVGHGLLEEVEAIAGNPPVEVGVREVGIAPDRRAEVVDRLREPLALKVGHPPVEQDITAGHPLADGLVEVAQGEPGCAGLQVKKTTVEMGFGKARRVLDRGREVGKGRGRPVAALEQPRLAAEMIGREPRRRRPGGAGCRRSPPPQTAGLQTTRRHASARAFGPRLGLAVVGGTHVSRSRGSRSCPPSPSKPVEDDRSSFPWPHRMVSSLPSRKECEQERPRDHDHESRKVAGGAIIPGCEASSADHYAGARAV